MKKIKNKKKLIHLNQNLNQAKRLIMASILIHVNNMVSSALQLMALLFVLDRIFH